MCSVWTYKVAVQYIICVQTSTAVLQSNCMDAVLWSMIMMYVAHLNKLYSLVQCSESPHAVHRVPIHYTNVGVRRVVSAHKIIGPMFFKGTINSYSYIWLSDRDVFCHHYCSCWFWMGYCVELWMERKED